MPRSNWGLITPALFGLAVFSASVGGVFIASIQSQQQTDTAEIRTDDPRQQGNAPQQAYARALGVPGPLKLLVANPRPQTQIEQDARHLEAQELMAAWGFWMAAIALFQLIATVIGLVFIKRTLNATVAAVGEARQGTEAALIAAKAGQDANRISRAAARRNRLETDRTLRQAKEATQHQLRAYLFPESAWLEFTDTDCIAFMKVRNAGQTPALNKKGWVSIWIEDFPLARPLPRPPAAIGQSSCVIAPGAHLDTVHPRGGAITARDMAAVKTGDAAIYVHGEIFYEDIFRHRHVSKYIMFCRGEAAVKRGALSPYMEGNEAD